MFTVKCITDRETLYECQVESSVEAIATAHLLAELHGTNCRCNVYKPGESIHFYNVFGDKCVTERCFT